MNSGFNKRGGHRRLYSRYGRLETENGNKIKQRHPPGLRGRAIGMWYAQQNIEAAEKDKHNYPSLTMDSQQAKSIDQVMSMINRSNGASNSNDWNSKINFLTSQSFEEKYTVSNTQAEEIDIIDRIDNIAESNFKDMYLKNIQGNKIKMDIDSENTTMKKFKYAKSSFIDQQRVDELMNKVNCKKYREMMKFREKLPSYGMRETILTTINNNQAVVLSGETGCGKTTQVPQFILDEAIRDKRASTCRIICTQPRRISAISVAKRVAEERAESIGTDVGYQIRLEKVMPRDVGSILYCTTGIVLQWLQTDPFLSEVSHLIIDEVHERDSLSDFLICVAKDILPYRPDLKVVLMSATLNAENFSHYFGHCPKIHIPGYTFPVKEYYLEDVIEILRFSYPNTRIKRHLKDPSFEHIVPQIEFMRQNKKYTRFTINELLKEQSELINYDLIVELLRYINRQTAGAILIFVPGWEEISSIHKLIQNDKELGSSRCLTIPLHSMMPTVNQREIFNRPPKGIRKIIIATNIAETSITIDDIVYVVDCGKIKMKNYNKEKNVATLQSEWVALANAKQRKGRAGRVQKGICFHLYSRARESLLDDYPLPEIQRTQLEEVVLTVKILQLGLCEEFLSKIMEPPDTEVLHISLKLLKSIRALDKDENLTPLGYHLARLPVDPFIGKMLITGAMLSCIDPILTIAAALAFKDPFVIPLNQTKNVDTRKRQLDEGKKSDHLLLVTLYDNWEESIKHGEEDQFAWDNYLSIPVMHQLKKLRKDFMQILCEHNFVRSSNPYNPNFNRNSCNMAVVKAVITAGLYPKVARIVTGFNGRAKFFSTVDGRVSIHPKSVNGEERLFQGHWLVYWQKMRTAKVYLYDTTMVDNYAILFFGEKVLYDNELECITVDNFIQVKSENKVYLVIKKLRDELDSLLEYKISHPSPTNWDLNTKEGYLLNLIMTLLTEE